MNISGESYQLPILWIPRILNSRGEKEMIEITNNNGTITVGIDYLMSLVAELNFYRGQTSALANILESVDIPRQNIIDILKGVNNVRW